MKNVYTSWALAAVSWPLGVLAQAVPGGAPAVPEDIRDIRDPIFDPAPWWEVAMPYALGAAGALALYFVSRLAWRWLHRPRNPMRRALDRIDSARGLASQGQVAAFADELSDALRAYIEERFEVHAPRQTTDELLVELAADDGSPLRKHRHELGAFLRICDEAKFGGYEIESQAMDALAAAARDFVTQTYRATDEQAAAAPAAPASGAAGDAPVAPSTISSPGAGRANTSGATSAARSEEAA